MQATFAGSGAFGQLLCGQCGWDTSKLCAYVDDGSGPPPAAGYPLYHRDLAGIAGGNIYFGFDDPQADPTPGAVLTQSVRIQFVRADLFDLGGGLGTYFADDAATGNPPWGSQPPSDMDADGVADSPAMTDRHNQGSYSAIFELDTFNFVLGRPDQFAQQFPNDAFAEPSCPGFPSPCDVYANDCGGIAKHSNKAPTDPGTGLPYLPYTTIPPPSAADWPVIPLPRDWVPGDAPSVPAIKRLLRM
jgi:hypothetical protein